MSRGQLVEGAEPVEVLAGTEATLFANAPIETKAVDAELRPTGLLLDVGFRTRSGNGIAGAAFASQSQTKGGLSLRIAGVEPSEHAFYRAEGTMNAEFQGLIRCCRAVCIGY